MKVARKFDKDSTLEEIATMTREEAANILAKYAITDGKDWSARPHFARACQLAIEALASWKDWNKTTNADRIRAMSDEELAEFLWSIGSSPLTGNVYLNGKLIFFTGNGNGWLDWLKQEVDDDEQSV